MMDTERGFRACLRLGRRLPGASSGYIAWLEFPVAVGGYPRPKCPE